MDLAEGTLDAETWKEALSGAASDVSIGAVTIDSVRLDPGATITLSLRSTLARGDERCETAWSVQIVSELKSSQGS